MFHEFDKINFRFDRFLLAHLAQNPKGQVSFCHHFASIVRVCKLFIFSSSSLNPLNRFGPNFAEMFYQIYYFGADWKSNMADRANNVF